MPTHIVDAGEHLAGIAFLYGFSNLDTIWNDPKNADLKKRRPDPNILAAGDEVFIPQKLPKQESVYSGDSYTFKVKRPKLKLRLALLDFLGQPIVGQDVRLEVDGDSTQGTDDNGVIELDVAANAKKASVTYVGGAFELEIGHLDPIEVESGVRARLGNLGYLLLPESDSDDTNSDDADDPDDAARDSDDARDPDDEGASQADGDQKLADSAADDDRDPLEQEALRFALQDFQADNDLEVTGTLDQLTRDKLRDVHGC